MRFIAGVVGDTEKNRTNASREGDPRKKITMARSCHKNGWSAHSEASTTVGSRRKSQRRPGRPRI